MPAVTLTLYGDPMTMNELVRLAKAGKAGKARGIAYVISDEIDRWQDLAHAMVLNLIRSGKVTQLRPPVKVTAWHLRVDNTRIDTMAAALAVKSAVDGCVRAGLLADDRDTIVVDTDFPAHKLAKHEGIELRFEQLPADEIGALL